MITQRFVLSGMIYEPGLKIVYSVNTTISIWSFSNLDVRDWTSCFIERKQMYVNSSGSLFTLSNGVHDSRHVCCKYSKNNAGAMSNKLQCFGAQHSITTNRDIHF